MSINFLKNRITRIGFPLLNFTLHTCCGVVVVVAVTRWMILLLGWPVQSWLDHNAILIESLELQVANPHRLYTAIIVLRFPRIDSISVYPQLLFSTLSFRLCAYRVVPRIQTLQVACKVSNKWFPETCFSRKGINSRKRRSECLPEESGSSWNSSAIVLCLLECV